MNRALELFACYGSFEPQSSEYNICKAVVECFDEIETMSAAQMAARAFTSEPTIRRFCRKLGYDSFAEFKKALIVDYHEIKTITSVVLRMHNNAADSIFDLLNKSIQTLIKVQELFTEERLNKLRVLVAQSDRVRIYSAAPLGYVPLLTAILHSRGIDVESPLFIHHQREDIVKLNDGSLVFLLGDPRFFNSAFGEQIELAYKKGVKFCLCLNEEHSLFTKYASVDFSVDMYRPCGFLAYEYLLGAIMRAYVYDLELAE